MFMVLVIFAVMRLHVSVIFRNDNKRNITTIITRIAI